jgi:hypothetical protein
MAANVDGLGLVPVLLTLPPDRRAGRVLRLIRVAGAFRMGHGTLWRNREAHKHFDGAIENVKDVITGQAMILALAPLQVARVMRR